MTSPDHVDAIAQQRLKPRQRRRSRLWIGVFFAAYGVFLAASGGWQLWQGPAPRTVVIKWTDCHPRLVSWELQPGEVNEDCTETRLPGGGVVTSATIHRVDGKSSEGETDTVPNPEAGRFTSARWWAALRVVLGCSWMVLGWLFAFARHGAAGRT